MARTDNLGNWASDVADTIRSKTGKTDKIPLSKFDIEIAGIKTDPVLQDKTLEITENGTTNIVADEGYDGLGKVDVTVNVETGNNSNESAISRLPIEYQEVEYIESSGTQYINTNVNTTSNIKIEIGLPAPDLSIYNGVLYGGGINWLNTYIQGEFDSDPTFAFNNSYAVVNIPSNQSDEYVLIQDRNKIYVNDNLLHTFSDAVFSTEYPIYLFTYNRGGKVGEFGSYKISYCKIYENDNLIREFIPCYKKSDNKVGLYDLINNIFYDNSGADSFIKGNDVINKITASQNVQSINSMRAGTIIGTPPDYLNTVNKNRGTYIGFDIKITPGEKYTIIGQPIYEYRVLQVDEITANSMKNKEKVTDEMFIYDTGYMGSSTFEVTAVDNAAYLWCMCRYPNDYEATVELNKAVPVFVIGGEQQSEDLTEELTDYGNKLGTQKTSISTIIETLQNKAKNGSNIYIQSEEPGLKNGIWLEKENTEDIDIYYMKYESNIYPTLISSQTYPTATYGHGGAVVGKCIYTFGGLNPSYTKINIAYKYDIVTNKFTALATPPFYRHVPLVIAVGTDVYIIGGTGGTSPTTPESKLNWNHKYDTLTDTYTRMSDLPYSAHNIKGVAVDTDIYIFGGNTSGSTNHAYKYDTLTDTYTQLTPTPYVMAGEHIVADNEYIYIFGGGKNSDGVYGLLKYNITEDTYEFIQTDFASLGNGYVYKYNNYVYNAGGYDGINGGSSNKIYKYDLRTNTYEQVGTLATTIANFAYGTIDNIMYILGGQTSNGASNYLQKKTLFPYDKPTAITKSNVWLYESNEQIAENVPTYIGDGNKWEKIN